MIYWQYILIFAVFFYAGWNLFRLLRRIRRDHFQKMAVRKLLKRSRIERGRMYFNSDVLRRTIAFLLGCRSQSARRALLNMACGKTAPAEAFLRRRGRETDALLLEALSAAEPDKRLSPVETAVFACLPAIKTPRKNHRKRSGQEFVPLCQGTQAVRAGLAVSPRRRHALRFGLCGGGG